MRKLLPVAVLLLLIPVVAHAEAAAPGGVIDQIVTRYRDAANGWEGSLQRLAELTFGGLVVIQLAISFGMAWILGGRLPDAEEAAALLVRNIMFAGLFFWLLSAFATWNPWIIHSFTQAAGQATGLGTMSPGSVFAYGIEAVEKIGENLSFLSPGPSIIDAFCAIIVLACFCLITAAMVLALVQSYFIAGAGVLFMAFGACEMSRDIAVAIVRLVLGIGARLFALQLIVGLAAQFVAQWVQQFTDVTIAVAAIEAGQSLVLLVVVWEIPPTLEKAIGGAGFASPAAVFEAGAAVAGTTIMAGRMAAGGALSLGGMGAALGAGASSARASLSAKSGFAAMSPARRMAAITGGAISTVGAAAARDIGRRLSGQSWGRGVMGARMATDLKERAPTPPASVSGKWK